MSDNSRPNGPNWPAVVAFLGILAIPLLCLLGALWILVSAVTR